MSIINGFPKEKVKLIKQNSTAISENLMMELKNYLGYFEKVQKNDTFEHAEFIRREPKIESDLIRAAGFLRKVINEFEGKCIDGRVGCPDKGGTDNNTNGKRYGRGNLDL